MITPTYLLDTDVCIYWMKGHRGIEKKILQHGIPEIGITIITACELFYGAYRSERKEQNLEGVKRVLRTLFLLHTSEEAAEIFGRLKASLRGVGRLLDDADLLIASIALAHRATLITHNTRHFARIKELAIEDWTV